MREQKHVTVNLGGLSTILFLIFLVLKLTGTIDWSWWWVTAPLWISVGFSLVILLIYIIVLLCIHSSRKRQLKKMKKWGDRFDNQRFTW